MRAATRIKHTEIRKRAHRPPRAVRASPYAREPRTLRRTHTTKDQTRRQSAVRVVVKIDKQPSDIARHQPRRIAMLPNARHVASGLHRVQRYRQHQQRRHVHHRETPRIAPRQTIRTIMQRRIRHVQQRRSHRMTLPHYPRF